MECDNCGLSDRPTWDGLCPTCIDHCAVCGTDKRILWNALCPDCVRAGHRRDYPNYRRSA